MTSHAATRTGGSRARLLAGSRGPLVANIAARLGALVALGLGTILVARTGGPTLLGAFTLLRVLPGLAGVLVSCGLPGAAPYFLASRSDDPRLRPTLLALTAAGGAVAGLGWLLLTPVLHTTFFAEWGLALVAGAAVPVFTQIWVAVGKACLQGEDDLRAANVAILFEEAAFLPAYLGLALVFHGPVLLLAALVLADVVVAAGIGVRLARRGFFRHGFLRRGGRPDPRLGREICSYGLRGQVGGLLSLLNLRLDVAILGALAGPAALGIYAVASKFAELLRMPGLAVTYVLYPRFARRSHSETTRRTAALIPPAAVLTVLAAIPLFAAAGPVLPLLYGHAFDAAVAPSYVLLFGLLGEGVAGLITAYLYGVGRPGANSWAMGAGVLITVALDVVLIPRYGAMGAAIASAAAYLTTTVTLLAIFGRLRRITGDAPAPLDAMPDSKPLDPLEVP